jgi:phosphoribosylformimino-5-aminoimidazole carboxamide ribotide isomerase
MLDAADPSENRPPRVIPVIDVMNGVVVRAVGGRREEYRPLVSRLTDSTDPVEVAPALLDRTGSDILYVADLDAITRRVPSEVSARLADAFPDVWVWADIGLRDGEDARRFPEWRRRETRWPWRRWELRRNLLPVMGTETLEGEKAAGRVGGRFAPNVVVSLDLRDGLVLGYSEDWRKVWGVDGAGDIDRMVDALRMMTAADQFIVLDLSDVGSGNGATTDYWLKRIKCGRPELAVVGGGGVRTWTDIDRLARCHVDGVLVASALHDGTLTFPRPTSSV